MVPYAFRQAIKEFSEQRLLYEEDEREYAMILKKAMKHAVSKLVNSKKPLIIGMIHVPALPGTPTATIPLPDILNKVKEEAMIYARHDLDGIIVENMFDRPYQTPPAAPAITASMTLACYEVAKVRSEMGKCDDMLLGVQILAACNKEALAVANATGFDFIRAEGFVYSHVADEGWIDACAGDLLRYRRQINADHIAVFADIKKKHSAHSVTSDVSIAAMAKDAEFNLADGVIVTGTATGEATDQKELNSVWKSREEMAVLVGSGVTAGNLGMYASADGIIIGSEFKEGGKWMAPLDENRIKALMKRRTDLFRD